MDFDKSDIQANILKGHGRDHACFIFCRFLEKEKITPEEIRSAIIGISDELTSFQEQCTQRDKLMERLSAKGLSKVHKNLLDEAEQENVIGLYLTREGYKKMRISSNYIPSEKPFIKGMREQNQSDKLGDYFPNDEIEKDFQPSPKIDCLIFISSDNKEKLFEKQRALLETRLNKVVKTSFTQYARIDRDDMGNPKEHFGYSEGFSTPVDEEVLARIGLVEEPGGRNTHGSYVVFRKIEQNVSYFQKMVAELQSNLDNKSKEYAMALLMGRFPNGTPLAFSDSPNSSGWDATEETHFIDYSKDKAGHKCPFHAHIRAVNPRHTDSSGKVVTTPEIIRRSMTYFDGPDKKGLCFLSYQGSIEKNFLPLIERMGVKNSEPPTPKNPKTGESRESITLDAITYRPRSKKLVGPLSYLKKYDDPSSEIIKQKIGGRNLTVFKGGEYFFAPSISFLKNLHKFAE